MNMVFGKCFPPRLRGQYALFCGGVDAIIVFRVAFDPMNGSAHSSGINAVRDWQTLSRRPSGLTFQSIAAKYVCLRVFFGKVMTQKSKFSVLHLLLQGSYR